MKTLLDSFAAKPFEDPMHEHKDKTTLQLQIEYARRAKVKRLPYKPVKKRRKRARKTKHHA